MANLHVLNSSKDSALVIFHVPAPVGNNFAGKPWADCVKEYEERENGATITSQVPWLPTANAAENAQVESGAMIERMEVVHYDGNLSNGAKAVLLDARWAELNVELTAQIQENLNFWGLDRDVT